MASPFSPQTPTVIDDTGRPLPEAALRCISANLSTGNVEAAVLLSNARMLFVALQDTEAKLLAANRRCAMFEKQFKMWVPTIRKLRTNPGGKQ
jgi:hypothetical protein